MYITTMGVINKKLTLLKDEITTEYRTNSVNVDKIIFNFCGSEWDGLTKFAVFITESGKIVETPLIDDYCIVPAEAYVPKNKKNKDINYTFNVGVGVYGVVIDNETNEITRLLPTNLVNKTVRIGAYFQGEMPQNLPVASEWEIYLEEIGRLASEVKLNADACAEIQEALSDMQEVIEELARQTAEDAEECSGALEAIRELSSDIARMADEISDLVDRAQEISDTVEEVYRDAQSYSEDITQKHTEVVEAAGDVSDEYNEILSIEDTIKALRREVAEDTAAVHNEYQKIIDMDLEYVVISNSEIDSIFSDWDGE